MAAEDAANAKAKRPMAPSRCAAIPVDVTAATGDEISQTCSAATEVLHWLDVCKLSLRKPLHIQVTTQLSHTLARAVFGFFDADSGEVYVSAQRDIPALISGTPYEAVPPPEIFKSAVVHELVHAVMHQHSGTFIPSAAGQEYTAYALQISSLPASERAGFLKRVGPQLTDDGVLFNDIFLAMNPFLFAATAYNHFDASPDKCAVVVGILRGEVDFIATLY